MKLRRILVLVAVMLTAAMLSGCSAEPNTPDAAVAATRAFLQARVSRDAGAVYSLLSDRTRKDLPRADAARRVSHETVAFTGVGVPVPVAAGERVLLQVPVTDVTVSTAQRELRWPEVRLTLEYDGRRWGVAWVEPLAANALQAYQNGRFGEALDLAGAITAADPSHYRGAMESHFAYRGLKRLREAELAILRARELATPSQVPDVEESFARFKISLGRPDDAIPLARRALEAAAPYSPHLYSQRWMADTWVVLGRALLASGDRAGAEDAAAQAEALDPQNADLAMLRRDLTPR
jgi:outer membrane murein-binding lipoprotein Lpp